MNLKSTGERIKNLIFEYGIFGSLTGFITVMPSVGSTLLLTTMYNYSPWLQTNQGIGVFIFISIMTFFCGLALVAINLLGVVSGFAFGFSLGLLAYLFGILGASTVMFLVAKTYAAKNLNRLLENKPKLMAIQKAIITENIWQTLVIIILIRLSPAIPFAVTNFIVSASGISYRVFIGGTILGMLPRMFAVVFIGSSLSVLDFSKTQESWLIILGIGATILAFFTIGMISKRALKNFTDISKNQTIEDAN